MLIAKVPTKVSKTICTFNMNLILIFIKLCSPFSFYHQQIDCNFHYLDIQSIESKNPSHFSIVTNDRVYSFETTGDAGNFSSVSFFFIDIF